MRKVNKVAGYRRMLGLTQAQLASMIGVSRSSMQNKESGKFPFKDNEKIKLVEIFKEIDPSLNVANIFFDN
ncbi:transcriptional regulator [Aerococcus sp. UMB1112A]|uniref:helix-turn-helix transcriptional regulator n=1 Tax=Aerococcus sp. UMB1112A TaxID=3050609 RepID=UPI00254ADA0A|nr:helix-turn-helix domain-containing protein [Aerococcus sp. UMB1112A]MDK8502123.1 transcriptional regulator [Aerococcus sp. UMB1112A]